MAPSEQDCLHPSHYYLPGRPGWPMSLHALRDTNSMEGKAEYTPWLAQATQQTESLSGLPSPTFTPLTPQALRVYILASSASANGTESLSGLPLLCSHL